jgi:hypothetical protein
MAIEGDEFGFDVLTQNGGSRRTTHVWEEVSFEQLDFCPLPVYDSWTVVFVVNALRYFISQFLLHNDVIFCNEEIKTMLVSDICWIRR